jgi:hypothetical protein
MDLHKFAIISKINNKIKYKWQNFAVSLEKEKKFFFSFLKLTVESDYLYNLLLLIHESNLSRHKLTIKSSWFNTFMIMLNAKKNFYSCWNKGAMGFFCSIYIIRWIRQLFKFYGTILVTLNLKNYYVLFIHTFQDFSNVMYM